MVPNPDIPPLPPSGARFASTGASPASSSRSIVSPEGGTHAAGAGGLSVARLLHRLLDWIRGEFGETTTTLQVTGYLDAAFPEPDWTKSAGTLTVTAGAEDPDAAMNGVQRTLSFRQRDDNGIRKIVTDPCHDQPKDIPAQEHLQYAEWSVAECLNHICTEYPEGTVCAQIPIAQFGRTLGGVRGHFALLSVDIENGKIERAALVDSKGGLMDLFYDGAGRLANQILEQVPERIEAPANFTIETEYLGDQSLINRADCGRFAVAHAQRYFADSSSGYQTIERDPFFRWCEQLEEDVKQKAAVPKPLTGSP